MATGEERWRKRAGQLGVAAFEGPWPDGQMPALARIAAERNCGGVAKRDFERMSPLERAEQSSELGRKGKESMDGWMDRRL